MIRPSFRSLAVATGFLGVSMIVAGTASAMTDAPATSPVASAVQLTQEDPASITPEVEAGTVATETVADAVAPVEVAPTAIQCSDAGLCEGVRDAAAPAPTDRARARTAEPAPTAAAPACEPPAPPTMRTHGGDLDAWRSAVDDWAVAWHAAARDCGWTQDQWREALAQQTWRGVPGDAEWRHGDVRDGGPRHDGGPRDRTPWRDGGDERRDAGRDPDARADR